MFASFVQYDNSTGKYSTYNETSPDEYSNHKNNSAMTNGAIAVTLRNAQTLASVIGKETPSNWTDIANNITILVDPSSNILLEFDGFNGTTAVKQADVSFYFSFRLFQFRSHLSRFYSLRPLLSVLFWSSYPFRQMIGRSSHLPLPIQPVKNSRSGRSRLLLARNLSQRTWNDSLNLFDRRR